jgi:hypothetical protein
VVPCPGKRAFASPKKAVDPFAQGGLLRFVVRSFLSPASLCGNKKELKWEGLIPALFVFGACFLARATIRPIQSPN